MWRSPVQEIPYESSSAADVHCVFFIADNLEHEGPLLLLQPLHTAFLVHKIRVGAAKVFDVNPLCFSFTRQDLGAGY